MDGRVCPAQVRMFLRFQRKPNAVIVEDEFSVHVNYWASKMTNNLIRVVKHSHLEVTFEGEVRVQWVLLCWPQDPVRSWALSACNAGDPGSIPGWGRSPGEGNVTLLHPYSCLENPMDRGLWRAKPRGLQRVGHNWATNTHTMSPYFGAAPSPAGTAWLSRFL